MEQPSAGDDQAARNDRYLAQPDLASGLGRRTARGGAIALAAQLLRFSIQITGVAILSRLLTPADYGLVAMAATVMVFIGMFTNLGLSAATIQRHEVSQALVSTLFIINLAFGVILWGVAAAVAPIAANFYSDPRLTTLIMCLAIAIPLTAAGAQHNALLVRNMHWLRVQAVPTISQIAGLLLAVLSLLTLHIGYWALAVQQVSVALFTLLMNWTFCRWRPSLSVGFAEAKSAISFGGYLTASNIINYFSGQADNALIGWRWGSLELGYYSRAYQLLTLPISLINQSASSVAMPALSRLQNDPKAWSSAYLSLSTVTSMGGVGLCAVLFAAAEPVILIAMGPQWREVIPIFRILSISSILATSSNSCSWVFMSLGQTKKLLYWSMFAVPLFLTSYVIGLPWGGRGVATAYAAAMTILAPLYFLYTFRHTSLPLSALVKVQAPIYLAAVLAGAGGYAAAEAVTKSNLLLQLIASGGLACTVYGVVCLVFVRILPQYSRIRAYFTQYLSMLKLKIVRSR